MNDRQRPIARRFAALAIALVAALPVALLPAGPATASAALDGGLVVGGTFTEAGGVTVNRIAEWDGVDWSALTGPSGTGADGTVSALTVYDGKLVAGGTFVEAGGVPVSGVATWDGTQWSPLVGSSGGIGVTILPLGFVAALEVYNGDLYVGGSFPRAGGTVTVNNIARWDGSDWFALSGPSGVGVETPGGTAPVWDLTVHDGHLVAAGSFTLAGGETANSVASWDGTGWSPLDMDPLQNLTIMSVTEYQGDLVAASSFVENNFNIRQVLRRSGGTWSPLSGPSGTNFSSQLRSLTVYNQDLYVGGGFTQVGSLTVNRVVRWDGTDWSPLTGSSGTGVNLLVRAFEVYDGDLYVGGHFTQAGGLTVNGIARWDGTDWSPLVTPGGTGTNGQVRSLLAS